MNRIKLKRLILMMLSAGSILQATQPAMRLDDFFRHPDTPYLSVLQFSPCTDFNGAYLPESVSVEDFSITQIMTSDTYRSHLIMYTPGMGSGFRRASDLRPGMKVRYMIRVTYTSKDLVVLSGETIESYQDVQTLSHRIGDLYQELGARLAKIHKIGLPNFYISQIRFGSLMLAHKDLAEAQTNFTDKIVECDQDIWSIIQSVVAEDLPKEVVRNQLHISLSDHPISDSCICGIDMYVLQHKSNDRKKPYSLGNPIGAVSVALPNGSSDVELTLMHMDAGLDRLFQAASKLMPDPGIVNSYKRGTYVTIPFTGATGMPQVSKAGWEYYIGIPELFPATFPIEAYRYITKSLPGLQTNLLNSLGSDTVTSELSGLQDTE